jgi:glycosyltransferase involved in cell wall biosynthesis
MKKILIFSHEFPPFGGGAGVVAYQYCIELQKQGYEVTLLTRNQDEFPDTLNNINIISVVHIPKIWYLVYFINLKAIDLNKFDSIILNDIAAGYVAGKYFDKEILNRCIPILHGSEPENIYNNSSVFFKFMRFKHNYDYMLNNSKKIVAVSNYMKEKFLEETTFTNKNKIEVVYSGLSDDFFAEKKVNCTDVYNYVDKEIILSVSRIEKKKGFLDMYELFKKLISIDENYIWIIIGDGSFKNELEEMVKKDRLQNSVIFKGKTHRNELYKYYKCADVFWLLSHYKESFGLVYLEAQAYGCPVIGYSRFGVKEAIIDKKTGFLVQTQDEVLDILSSKKYLELKQEDVLSFAARFSLSEQGKVLEEFI